MSARADRMEAIAVELMALLEQYRLALRHGSDDDLAALDRQIDPMRAELLALIHESCDAATGEVAK